MSFFALVFWGMSQGYIVRSFSLETIGHAGLILLSVSIALNAINSFLVKSQYPRKILRWLTIGISSVGYFAFMLWNVSYAM
jgi:hypothetical protein